MGGIEEPLTDAIAAICGFPLRTTDRCWHFLWLGFLEAIAMVVFVQEKRAIEDLLC